MTRDSSPLPAHPLDRRKFLIGAGLLASAGTAWARTPQSVHDPLAEGALEKMVPKSVGPWRFVTESGVVLPPPDALSERLYDSLVTRVYADANNDPVMLLIAYNNRQDGVLQIHRPEFCYPAGGFTLTPTTGLEIPMDGRAPLPASTFVATNRDRNETVLYFTRVGEVFPRRWSEQRLAVIDANLRGTIPDGLLFRVSKFGNSAPKEVGVLEEFVRQFIRAAPPPMRLLLSGAGAAQPI